MVNMLKLLFQKDFSALFWAQFAGVINDNLFRTAIGALIAYQVLLVYKGYTTLFLILNSSILLSILSIFFRISLIYSDNFIFTSHIKLFYKTINSKLSESIIF